MKKWIRNLLSLLLIVVMACASMSPLAFVKASESTKVTITGIEALAVYSSGGLTGLAEMYFTTDTTWAGSGTNSGKTITVNGNNVSTTVNTNGTSGLLLQHWGGANMDNGNIVTLPAGLQFVAGGVTYELKTDFSFKYTKGSASNNGTYEIVDTSQPKEPTKVTVTGIEALAVYSSGGLTGLAEMYFTTDTTWAGSGTNSGKTITINGSNVSTTVNTNSTSGLLLQHWGGANMDNGNIITIPAGLQFVAGGTTYEIAKDFSFKYTKGTASNNGTYEIVDTTKPLTPTKVTITGIDALAVYSSGAVAGLAEMYFTTATTWAGAGTNSGKTIKVNGANVSSTVNTNGATGLLMQHWGGANMDNGNIVTIPAGLQFVAGNITYEIEKDFSFKYTKGTASNNGTYEIVTPGQEPPAQTPVQADVTVSGIYFQAAADLFLTTNLSTSHVFTGSKFTTSDISITKSDKSTTPIASLTVHPDNGTNTVCMNYEASKDDVLTIKKDGIAVNEEKKYTIKFTEEFKLQYNGTAWEKYQEPAPQPPTPVNADVTIKGFWGGSATEIYLTTNLGNTHTFAGSKFTTDAITVTRGNDVQNINTISVLGVEGGSISFTNAFAVGDILKIAAGKTATNSEKAYTMTFKNNYALQWNGTKWETYVDPDESANYSYENVSLSGIYVQGGNDLYLTTGIEDSHKYKGISFTTSDIVVLKPDGTTDKVAKFSMHPSEGKLYVAFSYLVQEGMGIHIADGATAVNVDNECGIKFVNDFSLFYTNGKWVVDNDAPVIKYRGEELIAGNLYGLRLGMTKTDVEALFTAEDAIQGKKEVVFTYPADMYDAENKLQTGTFEIKVSAADNSGNKAEYTIKVKGYTKDVPTITFVGEAEREFDAGKKFDTKSLKATAKDGNGKSLTVKFSYSDGALDKTGKMRKGIHKLYLTATDDEGQQFTKAITLKCYDFTNVKVTGFYYFLNNELYLSTNMKDPTPFKGAWLTSDNILINDKSGTIPWVAVDQNTGSLYIICEKKAGDIMTIAEGATFVDNKNFVGIRVENKFKAHTDGIGWIVDRIPRGRGSVSTSPATGDHASWIVYACICMMTAGAVVTVQMKKKEQK